MRLEESGGRLRSCGERMGLRADVSEGRGVRKRGFARHPGAASEGVRVTSRWGSPLGPQRRQLTAVPPRVAMQSGVQVHEILLHHPAAGLS